MCFVASPYDIYIYMKKKENCHFLSVSVCLVSVLLSAHVKIFSDSLMLNFFLVDSRWLSVCVLCSSEQLILRFTFKHLPDIMFKIIYIFISPLLSLSTQ